MDCSHYESEDIHKEGMSVKIETGTIRKKDTTIFVTLENLPDSYSSYKFKNSSYEQCETFLKSQHKFKSSIVLPSTSYSLPVGIGTYELIVSDGSLMLRHPLTEGERKAGLFYNTNFYLTNASYEFKRKLLCSSFLIDFLSKVLDDAEKSYNKETKAKADRVIEALMCL